MKTWLYPLSIILLLSCNINAQSVDPETFEQGLKADVQILDVRTPEEYEQGHIANAMLANINDGKEFERRVASLEKDKPVYVYCLAGGRSSNAASILKKKGFTKVIDLDGGINAWRNADKPLEGAANTPPPISLAEYERMVSEKDLVLVDFGAPWCPPCRKMEPVLNELEKTFSGSMSLVKIDGGSQGDLMNANKIEQMPGFILYKNGKEVWRGTGVMEKQVLVNAVQQQL